MVINEAQMKKEEQEAQEQKNLVTNKYEKIAYKVQQDRENSFSGYLSGVALALMPIQTMDFLQKPSAEKAVNIVASTVASFFPEPVNEQTTQAHAEDFERMMAGKTTWQEWGVKTAPIWALVVGAAASGTLGGSGETPPVVHESTPPKNTVKPKPVLELPPRTIEVGPDGNRLYDVPVGALFRDKVTTGATSDGITTALRKKYQRLAAKYGTADGSGPIPNATGKDVQVGHVAGQAHVLSPEGTVVEVTPQSAASNREWSIIEKAYAERVRQWNAEHPNEPQIPVRPSGQKRN